MSKKEKKKEDLPEIKGVEKYSPGTKILTREYRVKLARIKSKGD